MAQHPLGTVVDIRSARLVKVVSGVVDGGLVTTETGRALRAYARSVRALLESADIELARTVMTKIEIALEEDTDTRAKEAVKKHIGLLRRVL